MSETITSQVKNIISNQLDLNLSVEEIDENASLFEDGLNIDSLATVELISLIEDDFKIEFDDDDLNPENFENVKSITNLIKKKQSVTT